MYPEYMAKYPDYAKMIDKSYMLSVISNHPELMEGKTIAVTYAPTITDKVSSKSFQIQFESGSATIKSESFKVLDEILKSSIVAENLKIGVNGHTDNTGNPAANQSLSELRAASVKRYLESKGITSARIESKGVGSNSPVADNNTVEGKAQNRRVEIVLGQ
jgi:outer membrane protein OmpA-like peptidoglycan-associated protein